MTDAPRPTLVLDGREVPFTEGETILEVATREGVDIPTLCHDPRLEPAGVCRTCLVEVEGARRLAPSCATRAVAGMRVATASARVQRHRRGLLALYAADHPGDRAAAERRGPNALLAMIDRYDARDERLGRLSSLRAGRPHDDNPYIDFDPDACILCERCVRYCDEVEAVQAITLAGRGARTTISTADGMGLMASSCELCGGCVDTCPTGAMAERLPLSRGLPAERDLTKVRTTCNFCGVGCQLDLNVDPTARGGRGQVVKVTSPPPGTTTNDGNLCVKGRFAYDFLHHADRLTAPLVRGPDGRLHPTTWDDALTRAAEGLRAVADRHGPDALGFVSSSRCTVEENYLVQKLARAVFGTHNVHQCAAT